MKNFVKWFGIIIFVAVTGFSFAACDGSVADIGQDVLYGTWISEYGNNNYFVISSNQLFRYAYQPGSATDNGTYTINIKKWTPIQNTGDNRFTYPSGFRVEGVFKSFTGTYSLSHKIGEKYIIDFYLNSMGNEVAAGSSSNAAVFVKQR